MTTQTETRMSIGRRLIRRADEQFFVTRDGSI